MTELNQKPRRKIRGIYVNGVVALICACIPVWLTYRSQTHVTQAAQAYNFTGLVRSSTLKPISGAHIIFIQDEAAPENTYTDSNGSFTIRVKQDTVHLHLEVLADGYLPFSENAPLHRTGPDDIRLKEQVSDASTNQNQPRSRGAAPAHVGWRTRQPATKVLVQDCPGGICAGGNITGNPQITNNYGPAIPLPRRISSDDLKSGIAIIRSHQPGVVLLRISGSRKETVDFYGDVIRMFELGGWRISRTFSGYSSYSEVLPSGLGHEIEEDIVCASPPPGEKADAGILALKVAGHPCTVYPTTSTRTARNDGIDLEITVRPSGITGGSMF